MTDEELVNAIASMEDRTLRQALYAMHQRTLELEADNKTLRLSIGVGRWAGPMIVAIAAAAMGLIG